MGGRHFFYPSNAEVDGTLDHGEFGWKHISHFTVILNAHGVGRVLSGRRLNLDFPGLDDRYFRMGVNGSGVQTP